jgi:hypothetical protein
MSLPENENPVYSAQDSEWIAELTRQESEGIDRGIFDEEKHAWRIGGKKEGAWAMQKLAEVVRRQNENKAIAQDRIDEVNAWLKEENDKLQHDVDHFEGALRTWHMSLITADPDDEEAWEKQQDKTVSFPDGKLSVSKPQYSTVIEDGVAVQRWAGANRNDLLCWTLVSDAKSKLAEIIKTTGKVIPGVKYERSEPSFKVKPKIDE